MHHDLQGNDIVLKGLKRKTEKALLDVTPGKMVKKNKHCRASKAKWTADEDEILTRAVVLNGEGNWKKIAQSLSDRSHLQCLHRWQKVLNPALVKGPWKEEEDNKLVELVEKYGPKDWSTIASHIQGRIGKQCRERWFNHLSPEVRKTNWSPEEDSIIIEAHHRLGNKWTAISKLLDGRPANAIKNHWNSTLLKRIQDSNNGMPPIRRERKNSKTKSLSPSSFQPPMMQSSMNASTSSLSSSFSSEEDEESDSEDSEDFSSPASPESPDDSPVIQTRAPQPTPYLTTQYLQEFQMQQYAMMLNNPLFENTLGWEWSVPAHQQINVHTAGASVPIAMNAVPMAVGMFNAEKFMSAELAELYSQNLAGQLTQEMQQYCFDPSQVPQISFAPHTTATLTSPLPSSVEEYSPVPVDGMNFLNMDMPGFPTLPLEL